MSTLQSDPHNGGGLRWPESWWRIMEIRIGVIPLPVHLVLFAAVVYFLAAGKVPTEINVMIAVLAVFGFSCAELGKRLPVLKDIGGGAIFATFLPSCLVFYHVIPAALVTVVTDFTKSTNFLYLFIACIVVGSILGMDRTVLIKGFLKIFVPLAAGSLAAIAVGTLVGAALGLGARHALLFVVLPIMAGGVGEGAIPLSLGYADILHQPQSELFAQVLPPVMVGSLTAILLSGALNFLGKRFPQLTGEGRLQPGEHDDMDPRQEQFTETVDVSHIAAAGMTAVALYLLGLIVYRLVGVPAAVAMLFLAVLAKLTQVISPQIQQGAYVVYQFFARAVTYPLLFAIGVALTPWDKLVAALALPNLITIVATVSTLIGTGFVVGRWVALFPIDAAIVAACHSGQGGTGDVAILTAANRMQLMPFAQIATRIGGAITVLLTLVILARTV
jgi:malate:Na+ symporter